MRIGDHVYQVPRTKLTDAELRDLMRLEATLDAIYETFGRQPEEEE